MKRKVLQAAFIQLDETTEEFVSTQKARDIAKAEEIEKAEKIAKGVPVSQGVSSAGDKQVGKQMVASCRYVV